MFIKIHNSIKQTEVNIPQEQIDYKWLKGDKLSLFIYGHPIDFNKKEWLSCKSLGEYYQSGNWDFLNNIDGVFSLIVIDYDKNKLFVVTDRLGIYSLFYLQKGDSIVITDRIKELFTDNQGLSLDMTSILELLNLGFKVGNKTLYQEVSEFEPARIYSMEAGSELKEKEYWSVFDLKPSDKMSKEEFRLLFNKNLDVITSLEEKLLLPISGGKDTRMLLSAILDKKDKLHCYTFGPHFHSDIRESVKICNKLGISHSIIDSDNEFAKQIDFNSHLKDMNINGIGPYFFNLLVREALIREKGKASLALQGDLGNQTWRHHPFGRMVPQSMDINESALWMLKNITRVLYFKGDHTAHYSKLYKDFSIEDVSGILQKSIKDDLSKLKNPKVPSDYSEFFIFRTLAYNFYSNTMKFIGRHYKLFVSPLQKDLLQQLHLLSIDERVKGGHIDNIIAGNNKYLSSLPYYNSGRVLKYIKMISNMVSQKTIGTNVFHHPELHNYPLWIRKFHKDFFYEVLDPDKMVLGDLFNKDEVRKQIDMFLQNNYSILGKNKILQKYSNQHFIFHLFSLEQWLQDNRQNT